jgi:hypothetical protein
MTALRTQLREIHHAVGQIPTVFRAECVLNLCGSPRQVLFFPFVSRHPCRQLAERLAGYGRNTGRIVENS